MSDDFLAGAPPGPKRPRRARPLSQEARARLASGVPAEGDRIKIRWPGGPHDFDMDFEHLDPMMPAPEPGWFWLYGVVGSEYHERWGHTTYDRRTLYARYVSEGVYEMLPHGSAAAGR